MQTTPGYRPPWMQSPPGCRTSKSCDLWWMLARQPPSPLPCPKLRLRKVTSRVWRQPFNDVPISQSTHTEPYTIILQIQGWEAWMHAVRDHLSPDREKFLNFLPNSTLGCSVSSQSNIEITILYYLYVRQLHICYWVKLVSTLVVLLTYENYYLANILGTLCVTLLKVTKIIKVVLRYRKLFLKSSHQTF